VSVTDSAGQSYEFSAVSADGSITATYAINTYTITVTQTANGQITPTTGSVNYGATPTYTVTPATGYHIASITVNDQSVSVTDSAGQSYEFSAVSADGSITATYAINASRAQFYVTVDSAHGSPSQSSQWVDQGSSFTVSVTSPDVVTSGADQWVVTGPSSQTISDVESAQTLTFNWTEQFYVTVDSAHGSPSESSQWVNAGSDFSTTVTSPSDVVSAISQWVTSQPTLSITNVESAQTLTFSWTEQFYITVSPVWINTRAITVTQSAHGQISPGTSTVNYGSSQTFTITPNTGYYIASLTVDGSPVTVASLYTFSNVLTSHTITATFTPTSTPTPSATTVPVTTDDGATVDLTINGNITSTQMSDVTIATNQSATTTTVSFTVTGASGTTGFGNITIPKSAVPYGTTPTIYIDGQPAQNQGYAQDGNNYYLWYTTHFSTHQVSIVFTTTSPSPSPAAKSNLLQDLIYGLAIGLTIVVIPIVVLVLVLKKRNRTYIIP
jgi:hypothetical protein